MLMLDVLAVYLITNTSVETYWVVVVCFSTCYISQLAKHLKKCNAKPILDHPPYIVPGANSSADKPPSSKDRKVTLAEISDSDLLKLIKKIKHVAGGMCI